ncbi:venom prothrombin activator pseutarin-C non-catalytic subunit-like isoform X1 [Daphnia pulex]|uniref:venom prothrombin activator pseutarin-C non-catalytic subunit-like isoform X1 n=1 Tax=Daphnia pulex TaxID=6669 RepID=UPI001EDC98E7|nr:venom prothrombin activator pseutarin-C non-catalytic subunit-like isoform X1 [Daphnia pulex]
MMEPPPPWPCLFDYASSAMMESTQLDKQNSNGQRRSGDRSTGAAAPSRTSTSHQESSVKNCSRPLHLTLKKSPLVVSCFLLVQLISSVHLATGKSATATGSTTECPRLLGMSSGSIQDWQIASSSQWTGVGELVEFGGGSSSSSTGSGGNAFNSQGGSCQPKYARLYQSGNKAWCAKHRSVGEWILVDLGVISQVTGVMTQGREEADEWVSAYSISYSADAFKWSYVVDGYGNRRVYRGNVDASSVRYNLLDPPLQTRFVRLHVIEWRGRPSLRLEIVGCQECNQVITESPNVKLTSSSVPTAAKKHSCQPDSAHLFSHTGWCAKKQDADQWIQYDLGPPRQITGVVTRGHGGWESKQRHHVSWVSSYTLSYSNDTLLWFSYRDGNHLDPKIFGGNMDGETERRHYLNHPFSARYVRLHPLTWRHGIGLRAALLGCPHKAGSDCGPGFFHVNAVSGCMENLAYHHNTWLNDKRHLWKDWKYGRASLAVDGDSDASLHRCAILDNYFVENPVWMVDLGKKSNINGVVIATWQGKGQEFHLSADKTATYRDYQTNLEKLTVYVSNKPRLETADLLAEASCGQVSRSNDSLFQPRIHIQCQEDLRGRYLYIRASAVANRKARLFFSVLCEVMVY